jgi:uridine kinase
VAALVIGICGGTGSGKTTLTARIEAALSRRKVVVLQQDHYYKDLRNLRPQERARQNYDHPDSVDMPLMVEHVSQLRAGRPIDRPIYDFVHHCRDARLLRVRPRPAVIIEGILVFQNKALRDLMDIKVFVDADADLRFIRRLLRDVRERGRTVDSVVGQYLKTVRPMHTEFIEPSRHYADIVIREGNQNQVAIDLLIQNIRSRIEGSDHARKNSRQWTRFPPS